MLHKFLAACRYLLVIPVIGCVLLTVGVVFMGSARIVTAGTALVQAGDFSAKAAKTMSLAVIEIQLPMRLRIGSLKELEDKIVGIIVAALAVAFLGHAAGGDEASALLSYGGGIAVVIIALAVFMRFTDKKTESSAEVD